MKTRRQEPPGRGGKARQDPDPKGKRSESGSSRDKDRDTRRGTGPPPKTPRQGGRTDNAKPARSSESKPRQSRREETPALTLARPGRDLLYGRNAVLEALRGRRGLGRLYLADGVREDDRIREIIALGNQRDVEIDRVPRALLDDATHRVNHQGVALEAEAFRYMPFEDIERQAGTVLVLDHLQDPQNLGTLLRAAEAVGVAGVVIPQNRAVEVTPAVVNASAGAVEHLRVAVVPNLARALQVLKSGGRWVIGLDAGEGSRDFFATEVPPPAVVVVGAEGSGLGPQLRKGCDLVLALPMLGKVESLNAATAGSIALYDLLRRQREDAAPNLGDNAAAHVKGVRRTTNNEETE